jgi:hypothetical protein
MSNATETDHYLTMPNAWEPDLKYDEMQGRTSSFYAVLMPESMTEIRNVETYLSLMERRIEWAIGQWMEDTQMEFADVVRMVKAQLNASDVFLEWPRLETPGQLASALVTQPLRMGDLIREIPREFPLNAIEETQEVRNTVQYQTFEEWLIFYAKP